MARTTVQKAPPPPVHTAFPRMLFTAAFGPAQADYATHADPLIKKRAIEIMATAVRTVEDAEEEIEALEDGYKASPADFLAIDPRIPQGREAKRHAARQAVSQAEEILQLRRRLAELTGSAGEPAPVRASAPAPTRSHRARRPAAVEAAAPQASL